MSRTVTYLAVLALVFLTACAKSESAAAAAAPESAAVSEPPAQTQATEPTSPAAESTDVIVATSSAISEADIAAAPRIEPLRAWQLVQSGEAVLVDVRSEEQFAVEHIPGSKNIPLWDLEERAPSELDPARWVITSCT